MTFASLFLTHFVADHKLDDPKSERRVFVFSNGLFPRAVVG